MRIKLFRLMQVKSMFARLMAGFLLVLMVVTSFHLISYRLYISNIEKELVNNSMESLKINANKFDNYFEQIMGSLYRISLDDKFLPVLYGNISPFQRIGLVAIMNRYATLSKNVGGIFLLDDQLDYIISSEGVYEKEQFFKRIYNSPMYDKGFWLNEIKKTFYYNSYEVSEFIDYTDPNSAKPSTLLPIVLKKPEAPSCLLVALININEFVMSSESDFLKDFYVVNSEKRPVYPAKLEMNIVNEAFKDDRPVKRIEGGHLFTYKSKSCDVTYVKYLPDSEIKALMTGTKMIFALLIVSSILLSLLLSFLISRRYNNLARKIISIMSGVESNKNNSYIGTDFHHIGANIQKIVKQNTEYGHEIQSKDIILDSLFHGTWAKNLYLQPGDYQNAYGNKDGSYVLACFILHFKSIFFEIADMNLTKGTYLIKDLIYQYMKTMRINCSTFQTDRNRIVVIIDFKKGEMKPVEQINEVLDKLKEEEPYVFFTVALSSIQNDIFELDTVYRRLLDLSRHRLPGEFSQLLEEGSTRIEKGKYSLSLEQIERFVQLLIHGRRDKCIEQVKGILDYNIKNGVDNFNIGLLCTEILNCGVKALNDLSGSTAERVDFTGFYSRLDDCCSMKHYTLLCDEFITCITDSIQSTEKKREHIIGYIKNYIENHYAEDIYLDLLAEKLNLTKEYISLYFKQKTGVNLSDYISEYRVQKAMELLENTSLKIQDIGEKVGFSVNTFIRTFKRYMGKTPNEYRHSKLQG